MPALSGRGGHLGLVPCRRGLLPGPLAWRRSRRSYSGDPPRPWNGGECPVPGFPGFGIQGARRPVRAGAGRHGSLCSRGFSSCAPGCGPGSDHSCFRDSPLHAPLDSPHLIRQQPSAFSTQPWVKDWMLTAWGVSAVQVPAESRSLSAKSLFPERGATCASIIGFGSR